MLSKYIMLIRFPFILHLVDEVLVNILFLLSEAHMADDGCFIMLHKYMCTQNQ